MVEVVPQSELAALLSGLVGRRVGQVQLQDLGPCLQVLKLVQRGHFQQVLGLQPVRPDRQSH